MTFEKVIVTIKDVDMGGETVYSGTHWLNTLAVDKMTNKQIGEYILKKHGLDYGNTYTFKVVRTHEKREKTKMADGGEAKKPATFKRKVKSISQKLKGEKVPKKYQKDYGKRYDDPESLEAARKIAGAYKKKMEKFKK